jgi:hypothetical protein
MMRVVFSQGVEVKTEPKEDDEEDLKREIEVLGLGGVGRTEIKLEGDDYKPRIDDLGISEDSSSQLAPPDTPRAGSKVQAPGVSASGSVVPFVGRNLQRVLDDEDLDNYVDVDEGDSASEQESEPGRAGRAWPSIRLRVGPNVYKSFLLGLPETVPKELRERLEWLKVGVRWTVVHLFRSTDSCLSPTFLD